MAVSSEENLQLGEEEEEEENLKDLEEDLQGKQQQLSKCLKFQNFFLEFTSEMIFFLHDFKAIPISFPVESGGLAVAS